MKCLRFVRICLENVGGCRGHGEATLPLRRLLPYRGAQRQPPRARPGPRRGRSSLAAALSAMGAQRLDVDAFPPFRELLEACQELLKRKGVRPVGRTMPASAAVVSRATSSKARCIRTGRRGRLLAQMAVAKVAVEKALGKVKEFRKRVQAQEPLLMATRSKACDMGKGLETSSEFSGELRLGLPADLRRRRPQRHPRDLPGLPDLGHVPWIST